MRPQILLPLTAVLLAAACSSPQPYQQSYRANPTADVQANPQAAVAIGPIDYPRGMWGVYPIRPPAGLAMSTVNELISRPVYDRYGVAIATISAVIENPTTGEVRYVVATGSRLNGGIMIPVAALAISPTSVTVNASADELTSMPRYSTAELAASYPMVAVAVAPTVTPIAPAPLPPANPPGLRLAYSGSIVGYPVVDAIGQPTGRVEAVAVVPDTGEVRYAVIANPTFGLGIYIEVPATNARTLDGRVILSASNATWMQSPRYTSDQLRAQFPVP